MEAIFTGTVQSNETGPVFKASTSAVDVETLVSCSLVSPSQTKDSMEDNRSLSAAVCYTRI